MGENLDRLRQQADSTVAAFPSFRFAPYHNLSTAYIVDTLQTVLHFLFRTTSFEECLVATVNQGGDADTTGAIVGAIAGAFYGPEQIPRDWIRRLSPELREELCTLADRLVDICPLVSVKTSTILPPEPKDRLEV
jgi:ADP-ribosyl-[dinitrogen reductase] hydrolase